MIHMSSNTSYMITLYGCIYHFSMIYSKINYPLLLILCPTATISSQLTVFSYRLDLSSKFSSLSNFLSATGYVLCSSFRFSCNSIYIGFFILFFWHSLSCDNFHLLINFPLAAFFWRNILSTRSSC